MRRRELFGLTLGALLLPIVERLRSRHGTLVRVTTVSGPGLRKHITVRYLAGHDAPVRRVDHFVENEDGHWVASEGNEATDGTFPPVAKIQAGFRNACQKGR